LDVLITTRGLVISAVSTGGQLYSDEGPPLGAVGEELWDETAYDVAEWLVS
jgi:hypothetical protein